MRTKTVFSIIICTYNGSSIIEQTLRHLSQLYVDDSLFAEVLLIDNNSNDGVSTIASACWQQMSASFPLHIYHEPKPGKSYALINGIQKSQGQFIIICDDDNWLQPDYLMVAAAKFQQKANLGIAGGVTVPVADQAFPDWFEKYAHYYACGRRAEKEFDFTGRKFLWGAGMVIPRSLAIRITDIAHPQLLTCRKQNELISGGDDELCLRTWLLGYRTMFFPDLVLQHFMANNRLTTTYRDRLLKGFYLQSETVNAYRVFYTVSNTQFRVFKLLKKLMHFVWCIINQDTNTIIIIRNHLFFLSGGRLFKNPTNQAILNWYKANK